MIQTEGGIIDKAEKQEKQSNVHENHLICLENPLQVGRNRRQRQRE